MKTLPISEVRANLLTLVDDIDASFDRVTLTKSGKAKAVLMSADEFDSWVETIELMNDSQVMTALVEAQSDLTAGNVTPLADLTLS